MKSTFIPCFFALLMLGTGFARAQVPSTVEVSPDLGIAVVTDMPGTGDYDLYDLGLTAELQFRDWARHPWGYAMAIGYGEWTTDRSADSPGSRLYDFEGNLEIVPFGVSALYKAYADPTWSLIFEAGARYIVADSKIDARNYDQDPENRYNLTIDDSLLFTAGANADYAISPDIICSFGLGYRSDIIRGEVNTEFGPARDNIMESLYFSAVIRKRL